jgi:DNA-binding LacI/PurR family transcriptional regulator/biotin operon repressor
MLRGNFPNITDQVVEILREGMLSGRWRETIPGRDQLAAELGVSHTTMEAAMRRLTKEGFLASQGSGKRRRIIVSESDLVPRDFRIHYLSYASMSPGIPQVLDLMAQLRKAGFTVEDAPKSLLELDMDVNRIARLVQQNPADAWIIGSASREVLEWFSQQPTPAYAYFGNKSDIPIAGCSIRRDLHMLIRRLVELGHRRIVLLIREEHLKPNLSFFATLFLEALEMMGITPGPYNLPVWGYQPEGLRLCLDSLYKITPPTAIISTEISILLSIRDYQAHHGVMSPRDVSLINLDSSPFFEWCDPMVAHFDWDIKSLNRRVVRWAKNVAFDKDDRRQVFIMAKFVEGGTIGPAPIGR